MRDLLYYLQLVFETIVGVFGMRPYEEPPYAVLAELRGGVVIRQYEPRLAAEVVVPDATGKAGSNAAFRLLFAYISGANRGADGGEKIAMTVPVQVERRGEKLPMTAPVERASGEKGTRMRFFLPSKLTAATAPEPADPRVKVVEVPGEKVATLRFSGNADEDDIRERTAELLSALEGSSWKAAGEPVMLFYDAPFTLPFFKRNEAAVRVEER